MYALEALIFTLKKKYYLLFALMIFLRTYRNLRLTL